MEIFDLLSRRVLLNQLSSISQKKTSKSNKRLIEWRIINKIAFHSRLFTIFYAVVYMRNLKRVQREFNATESITRKYLFIDRRTFYAVDLQRNSIANFIFYSVNVSAYLSEKCIKLCDKAMKAKQHTCIQLKTCNASDKKKNSI
jgi:hypothetical protein